MFSMAYIEYFLIDFRHLRSSRETENLRRAEMDLDIAFKGQSINIAVYVHAINILNNILKFRNCTEY